MTQPTSKHESAKPDRPSQTPDRRQPRKPTVPSSEHEGATEEQVGDRQGPGSGFDEEPRRERDKGGVARS